MQAQKAAVWILHFEVTLCVFFLLVLVIQNRRESGDSLQPCGPQNMFLVFSFIYSHFACYYSFFPDVLIAFENLLAILEVLILFYFFNFLLHFRFWSTCAEHARQLHRYTQGSVFCFLSPLHPHLAFLPRLSLPSIICSMRLLDFTSQFSLPELK